MKLAEKIKQYHIDLDAKEQIRSTITVRTYHKVENRVKDHASGFKQTYDEVFNDIAPMVEARAAHMLGLDSDEENK